MTQKCDAKPKETRFDQFFYNTGHASHDKGPQTRQGVGNEHQIVVFAVLVALGMLFQEANQDGYDALDIVDDLDLVLCTVFHQTIQGYHGVGKNVNRRGDICDVLEPFEPVHQERSKATDNAKVGFGAAGAKASDERGGILCNYRALGVLEVSNAVRYSKEIEKCQ